MSPQSNLLHCQQTLTSRLTLLPWACWRLSLGCKKHLGSSIPKALRPPLSLCEQESGEHEPAHTQNIQGRSLCVSMLEGMLSLLERKCWTNGDLFQSCHHSLSLPVSQQAKDMPKGLGGHLMPLSLSQVFSYRTFYFLIETTALCSTEEYVSIRTKGGVRSFELLLRHLNVLFNLVPLSGQTVGESCFTKVITTKKFRLSVRSYYALVSFCSFAR